MTDKPKVTQADEKAAGRALADLAVEACTLAEAFARHRIAAEQSRDDVIEECARALDQRADCYGDKEQTMHNAMYWGEVKRCAKALRAMKGKKV